MNNPRFMKFPPELQQYVDMLLSMEKHAGQQADACVEMLGKARDGLEKARAAKNDQAGSVVKLLAPPLEMRCSYLASEIDMWSTIMQYVSDELDGMEKFYGTETDEDDPSDGTGNEDGEAEESGGGDPA